MPSVSFVISQGFRLGGVNDPLNVSLCEGDDILVFGGFQDGLVSCWYQEPGSN